MLDRVFDGDLRGDDMSSIDLGEASGASISSMLRTAGWLGGELGPLSTSNILRTGERMTPAGLEVRWPVALEDRAILPSSRAITANRSSSSADSRDAISSTSCKVRAMPGGKRRWSCDRDPHSAHFAAPRKRTMVVWGRREGVTREQRQDCSRDSRGVGGFRGREEKIAVAATSWECGTEPMLSGWGYRLQA